MEGTGGTYKSAYKLRLSSSKRVESPKDSQEEIEIMQDSEVDLHLGGHIGDYQIISYLGQGGEGAAILLKDKQGQKAVAKIFRRQLVLAGLTPEEKKVMHEEDVLQKMYHPRIPKSYGMIDVPEQGYCIALRSYVEGTSLEQKIREKGKLSEKEVAQIMDSALEVLEYLHTPQQHPRAGHPIIHRDIKPGNLVIAAYSDARGDAHDDALNDAQGEVHLIDFGIAKENHNTFTQVTAKGTLKYMPREQLVGDGHPSSDLYSLGVTALEALLGEVPEELQKDLFNHRRYTLPTEAGISKPFRKILEKMVEREHEKRYQSAAEIRKELRKKGVLKKVKEIEVQQEAVQQETLEEKCSAGDLENKKGTFKDFLVFAGGASGIYISMAIVSLIFPISMMRYTGSKLLQQKNEDTESWENLSSAEKAGATTGTILGMAGGGVLAYERLFNCPEPIQAALFGTMLLSGVYEAGRFLYKKI